MALPYLIEGIALLAVSQGRAQRGVRLFSAAHAIRDSTGVMAVPFWCADCEKSLALARVTLAESVFSTEWAAGLALNWQQAAAYALEAHIA